VAGVRYFTCEAAHGLFVKRAQVKIDKDAPVAQSVPGAIATSTPGPIAAAATTAADSVASDSSAAGGVSASVVEDLARIAVPSLPPLVSSDANTAVKHGVETTVHDEPKGVKLL
jgi:hypothetical protein